MGLVDLKSDLSNIRPSNPTPKKEATQDSNAGSYDQNQFMGDTNAGLGLSPETTHPPGTPLTDMVSAYGPGDGNLNNSQIGGRFGPPHPPEHSTYDIDGTATIGQQTNFNIPNPSLYSLPPDAPTFIDTSNPYPISTTIVDYFSGRKGEWGPGTLPLGFTSNMQTSLLSPAIQGDLQPLTWNVDGITSEHPFGTNNGFSLNTTPPYVQDLQLGSFDNPMLYPIPNNENPFSNFNPYGNLRPTTLYDISNNGITFTFDNTPAISDDGTYIHTPYGTDVTPGGQYGFQTLPPDPPSTHPAVNSAFGISYGEYNFNSISDLATRYRDIHIAGNDTNLYPYADTFAGVEDTESSLFTITNPSSYSDLTFTFSDTSVIQDGVYTESPYSNPTTELGNYGSSLLLTGGIQTMIPKTVLATQTNGGLAYGSYDFNSISELAVRYNDIHIPGNETNLYPYSNQNTGIFELTTGLHTIDNPNNNEFYIQDFVSTDFDDLSLYGGDNTMGEPPFVDTLGKLKSRFGTDGTGRYTISSQTTTQRYTFPEINQPTNYQFDTQFGYTYTEAYDNIYSSKILFRIKDGTSSPLGKNFEEGAWSSTNDETTINNYGYHSFLNVPKDYHNDSSTGHSFDSLSTLATRYKEIHTPYSNVNLYPYTDTDDWGTEDNPALKSKITTLQTINAINIAPSHTYPVIPFTAASEEDGDLDIKTIGPFSFPTTKYTGDGNYTWPGNKFKDDLGNYSGIFKIGEGGKFNTFYEQPDEGEFYRNNYGYNSLLEIPRASQETIADEVVKYEFDSISDLATRYKGISTSDKNIPGRSGGFKSSWSDSDINKRYNTIGNISLKPYDYPQGKQEQAWFSGPFMFTGTGDSGPYQIPKGESGKGVFQVLGKTPLLGAQLAATFASTMNYGRWQLSPKGLLWGVKQLGLQLLNPREETRLWNPLSPLASLVPTFHMDRHMNIAGFPGKREGLLLANVQDAKFPYGARYGKLLEVDKSPAKKEDHYKFNRLITMLEDRTPAADEKTKGFAKFLKKISSGGFADALRGGTHGATDVVSSLEIPNSNLSNTGNPGDMTGEYRLKSLAEINNIAAGKKKDYEKDIKQGKFKSWEMTYKMGTPGQPNIKRIGYDDDGNAQILFMEDLSKQKDTHHDFLNKKGLFEVEGNVKDDFYDKYDYVRFRISWKSKLNPKTGEQDGSVHTWVLVFRTIIDGLTDNFTGEYSEQQFVGRPDKSYIYKGFDRKIGFNLSIHPTSRQELMPLYEKLNTLVGLTSPDYDMVGGSDVAKIGHRMVAPIVKITLGNYLVDAPCILKSVNLTMDDKGTWEIDKGMQLPRYIKAAFDVSFIGDSVPRIGAKYFGGKNGLKGFDEADKELKGYDKGHTKDAQKI